jgi:hypothetical protein
MDLELEIIGADACQFPRTGGALLDELYLQEAASKEMDLAEPRFYD